MDFVIYCQGYRAAKQEEEEILKIKNLVPSNNVKTKPLDDTPNGNYLEHGKKGQEAMHEDGDTY